MYSPIRVGCSDASDVRGGAVDKQTQQREDGEATDDDG